MRIRYPDSFLKLLLIGFAFATLPLLWAFINANISFGNIAKQSEATISQAVETTRLSRALQEQSGLMERSARQYYVLKDTLLFDNYQQAYETFADTAAQLRKHLNNAALEKKLIKLQNNAASLHRTIVENKSMVIDNPVFLDGFVKLTAQINEIIAKNNTAIDMTSAAFTSNAKTTVIAKAPEDAAFKSLDIDGNGKISLQESIKESELALKFNDTDVNHDGVITVDEFAMCQSNKETNIN